MKRIIYNLFLCLMFLPFVSCESEDLGQHLKDTDVITLNLYTSTPVSRVAMEDELHEYALSHLDVFIFSNAPGGDDQKNMEHYERILTNVSPEGEVTLTGKKRNDFEEDDNYWVYVLANSTATTDDLGVIANLADLKARTQKDPLLHLTATSASNAPKNFLMDGIAFSGDTEPVTPGTVVLNDGTAAKTTELNVNLNRAAAKVVVELSKGDNVTFHQNEEEGYYLRNLPTVTTLLAGTTLSAGTQELVTTTKSVTAYSTFTANKVTVTAYVYAHSWQQERFFTDGTSLVLNIPLTYDGDGDLTTTNDQTRHPNSYYQIELRHNNERSFDRNHYYLITGTINAPGATEDTQPVDLDNLKYRALPWTEQEINVGGEDKPTYLKVNKDTLRIYNQAIDESLVFASSSPITSITVHENVTGEGTSMQGTGNPYFYNKYAVVTNLDGSNGNYTEPASGNQTNSVSINATWDQGLSGNITVNSTVPENKTIRYFYLLITNADGLKEKVLVEQYPVIYVTNQLGWYSYRSDFGSSYITEGTGYVGISLSGSGYYNWNWNGGYNYSNAASGFWYSKVELNQNASGSNMNIDPYYWDDGEVETTARDVGAGENARIYHIHVTATSEDYTVGRPRMTAPDTENLSYTDPSDDNKKLVSPSFMIASRLGVVTTTGGNLNLVNDNQRLTIFRNHCANYVEVVKVNNPENPDDRSKDIVYDDWRLPTEAELKIIMDFQGTSGQNADAIDYLLNARYYFGAAGPVYNNKNNDGNNNTVGGENISSSSKSVRCVRDAY